MCPTVIWTFNQDTLCLVAFHRRSDAMSLLVFRKSDLNLGIERESWVSGRVYYVQCATLENRQIQKYMFNFNFNFNNFNVEVLVV